MNKEQVLNEMIRTYIEGRGYIDLTLADVAETLNEGLAEINQLGPVNYKRYDKDLLLIAYINDAEKLTVSSYIKENRPVNLVEIDDTPFAQTKRETAIALIRDQFSKGGHFRINFLPALDEQEAYEMVKRFGEPKHEVDNEGQPIYSIYYPEMNLRIHAVYGEVAYQKYWNHYAHVIENRRSKVLAFDSLPEMYINPIKNMNRDHYLKTYKWTTLFLGLVFFVSLAFGEWFALIAFLSLMTFPYVYVWMESTKLYRRIFRRGTIREHLDIIRQSKTNIDRRTGDDVSTHTDTIHGPRGRSFSTTNQQRSRTTAERRKSDFTFNYIFINVVLKFMLYVVVSLFAIFLYPIAVPLLNKKGRLNYLAY